MAFSGIYVCETILASKIYAKLALLAVQTEAFSSLHAGTFRIHALSFVHRGRGLFIAAEAVRLPVKSCASATPFDRIVY